MINIMSVLIFWIECLVDFLIDTNVLEERTASIFRAEDGGSMFLQNDVCLQVNTALQPRRPTSTSSLP
jgi:hypothetical protein